MDAKSKASFINSIAAGSAIPCPNCGTANKSGTKFCTSCGTSLVAEKPADAKTSKKNTTPAFEQIKEKKEATIVKYVEPEAVFAKGLPSWSLEPPHIMVRRR